MYEKIVESLAAIDHVKAESTVQGAGVGPSDGEHSLSREPSVPRDELTVCTNTSKSGAPAVSQSGSHDELDVTARSDEAIYAVKPILHSQGSVEKLAFWDSFESAVRVCPP